MVSPSSAPASPHQFLISVKAAAGLGEMPPVAIETAPLLQITTGLFLLAEATSTTLFFRQIHVCLSTACPQARQAVSLFYTIGFLYYTFKCHSKDGEEHQYAAMLGRGGVDAGHCSETVFI